MARNAKKTVDQNAADIVVETVAEPFTGDQLSEQQVAALDNVVEVPTAPKLTETSTVDDLAKRYEDENDTLDWEALATMVPSELSAEQFNEITGLEYTAPEQDHEADEAERGLGDNKPMTEREERVFNMLDRYVPRSATPEDAEQRVKDATNAYLEHLTIGETNIRAGYAMAAADILHYRMHGKRFRVYHDMFNDAAAIVSEIIGKDSMTPSLKQHVALAARDALLLVAGVCKVGYFILASDRKVVSENDEATLDYPPPDGIPEGAKVLTGLVAPSNMVQIQLAVAGKFVDNPATHYVQFTNAVAKAYYEQLWDDDGGKLRHDTKGRVTDYETAASVKARLAKEKADEEAAKKEKTNKDATEALKAGTITPEEYTEQTGNAPPNDEEKQSRETGGSQASAQQVETSLTTCRSILNGNAVISGEDRAKLVSAFATLEAELHAKDRQLRDWAARTSDDALSALPVIRACAHDGKLTHKPQRVEVYQTMVETMTRNVKVSSKRLDEDEVRSIHAAWHAIESICAYDEESGLFIVHGVDDEPIGRIKV